jgi:DNA-directed RNA polymerase
MLPAVKPSPASNLRFVQQSLASLLQQTDSPTAKTAAATAAINNSLPNASSELFSSLYDLQLHLEQESFRITLEQLMASSEKRRERTGIGIIPAEVKRLVHFWLEDMTEAVRDEISRHRSSSSTSSSSSSIAGGLSNAQTSRSDVNLSSKDAVDAGPFLLQFERHPERLALLTISQFLKHLGGGGAVSSSSGNGRAEQSADVISLMGGGGAGNEGLALALRLVSGIGEAVEQEQKIMLLKDKRVRQRLSAEYLQQQGQLAAVTRSQRQYGTTMRRLYAQQRELMGEGDLLSAAIRPWVPQTRVKVGSVLASLLIQTAQVPVNADLTSQLQFPITSSGGGGAASKRRSVVGAVNDDRIRWEPAFSHGNMMRLGKVMGVIRAHEAVNNAMQGLADAAANGGGGGAGISTSQQPMVLPKLLPMVVPPRPWLSHDTGGYLTIKSNYNLFLNILISNYLTIKQTFNL